jgi:acetyl esterase/lipase
MIKRDAPVMLQPAAGLERYHNFLDPADLADYRAILSVGDLRNGKLPDNVTETQLTLDGVPAAKLTLADGDHRRLLLHIHGGGFCGGCPCTRQQAFVDLMQLAKVDLISLDYGLAPEHPYPEGLQDCVRAYQAILDLGYAAEDVVLIGESAGATYCLTVSMYLRDHQLPMPAGLVLLSPNLEVPDTKALRRAYEAAPGDLKELEFLQMYEIYLGDHDPKDPLISPKYGDFTGLPPMLIQCGGSEQMSPTLNLTEHALECASLAARANVDVTLHVWRYQFHVFLLNVDVLPEATAALRETAAWLDAAYDHQEG